MREDILRRFTSYLDQAMAQGEHVPEADAEILSRVREDQSGAAEVGDLYAVWAELTAVTQEVKLQSRGFKQLHEAVTALLPLSARIDALEAELLPAIRRATDQAGRAARERETEIERRSQAESIDVLLDVRERLQRSLDAFARAQESNVSVFTRFMQILRFDAPSAFFTTLREGYALSLERIDDYLEKHLVYPVDCLGAPFDARRMRAAALEVTDRVPEGTVLEIFRPGYERCGEIHRFAEVKVAKLKG
jgi:molecular chaperone GrpE